MAVGTAALRMTIIAFNFHPRKKDEIRSIGMDESMLAWYTRVTGEGQRW